MPSDAKKRDQARKKEAQKKRNQKIMSVNGATEAVTTNGTTNGEPVELTEDGEWSAKIESDFHFKFVFLIL